MPKAPRKRRPTPPPAESWPDLPSATRALGPRLQNWHRIALMKRPTH